MARSSRLRRLSGGNNGSDGRGSRKRTSETQQTSRPEKKRKKKEETVEQPEEELFKVEKIVGHKVDKNGVSWYKTRWMGYTASDDTWEPLQNVSSTGHVDRYNRRQRQRSLKQTDAGVAVIEYEDGEREMIDMKLEKFRGCNESDDDNERDDDTVNGDDDVNNFDLVIEGEWIEILWPHTNMYFPCKIISWSPLRAKKSHKKSSKRSSRKAVFEPDESVESATEEKAEKTISTAKSKNGNDEDESAVAAPSSKKRVVDQTPASKPHKRRNGASNEKESDYGAPSSRRKIAQNLEREQALKEHAPQTDLRRNNKPIPEAQVHEDDQRDDFSVASESSGLSEDFSLPGRPVERVGHGVPLFDEHEDDFGSSGDESVSDDEGEGINIHQYTCPTAPKLTFEEMWTLKLKRTQELMDRG
ncbi:hypothetical protein ACHAWF_005172 [Thalassiosira exigua]